MHYLIAELVFLSGDWNSRYTTFVNFGGIVIQTTKINILRNIFPADKALKILLTEEPNNFVVRRDNGKLVQNLAVAAAVEAREAKS
jgi:hypothetical protein